MKGGDTMPGFNQMGPMNQGAMSGRGQGVCRDRGQGRGGFGGGRGQRVCRGFGSGYTMESTVQNEATLQDRAKMLEEELAAVKEQLKAVSETKE